ncbi:alpha/beta hydrolase fold protein [[Leptolyngbya] sp. PCC 7376]|uniref:alpha/beta fold hydrolase n=1 Tax=[Leptolyngbya] sp. PCC 7376 TaxID=111781 RepID=UPI00029F0BD4|nr:alpha/beta hydrolase [[Leptolyngbya] sp. PCC 7376]AFY39548.1 alpha/beta hydrolase fold protein [[Leptolyngbya] sp. PCC 7376]
MTFISPTRRSPKLNHGLELSYLEWGQGGEPVLLLHGLADNALVWSQLGGFLAEKYHVVALDLRGHGDSAKPEMGYACDDYIEDFHALFEHLGWSQAHVLGHSWTGKLAAIWATREPQYFKSLMLADPFFNSKIPNWWTITFPIAYKVLPFLKLMGEFPSYEKVEAIAKNLKQFRGWNEWQEAIFKASIEPTEHGRYRSKFVKRACDGIFLDVMQEVGVGSEIEIPSLFIQPEKGLNRLSFQLAPYRKYLKHLTWQVVPGNHWAHIVEPAAFNQAVIEFLS